MSITTWAATTGDWDDSKFDRGWDGPSMSPAVATLSLAPSWTSNTNTWAAETLDWEQNLEPSYTFGISRTPGVGALELIQSYEWNQFTEAWEDVIGDWSSGPVPHVAISDPRNPESADLTLTGHAPAQGIIYTFPVDNADLTLTGQVPAAGIGTTISPDKGDIEFINSHSWDNYGGTWAAATTNWNDDTFAPDAVETAKNQPAAGELTLTPHAPRRTESIGFPIPNGDLTLSSTAPAHGVTHFRSPGKADLTGLQGSAGIWNDATDTWATVSDNWDTGELTPTCGVTYIFPIDESDDFIFSTSAPQWPHVKDPNYIAQVVLS